MSEQLDNLNQFKQLLGQRPLIDVRSEQEYSDAHIEGAQNIPLDSISEAVISGPVLLYCQKGIRSAEAAQLLSERGIESLHLQGGLDLWLEQEEPIVSSLSSEQLQRYARHISLAQLGLAGQQKLLESRVLVVGAGGLGSPVLMYLAAAGVGHLRVIDDDQVEISNLQRQTIHSVDKLGQSKVASAQQFISGLNPDVQVESYQQRLNAANIFELVDGVDLIVDGADNFPTRYLLNDVAVRRRIPVVSASVLSFSGQLASFVPDHTCYRCLYPEPPPVELAPSCSVGGILGAVTGVVGSLQAAEAIKLLAGVEQPLIDRLLLLDLQQMHFDVMKTQRDPDCPVCGPEADHTQPLPDYVQFCAR